MEPELDIITNGRERRAPEPRARPDDASAPLDPTRPATGRTATRWSAQLRWAWPVAAILALAAPTVYVATRPDGGADLVTGPPAKMTKPTPNPPPSFAPPSFAPRPQPDNRPEAFATQSLYADAARALGPTGQAGAAMIELIGSDYRGGQASVGVFGQELRGTVNVDLVCVGTGSASVWIQDQSGESDAGPPTLLDCANPRSVRLTSTISGAGFFVYANLDPKTVAVLAYVPTISISVEEHGF